MKMIPAYINGMPPAGEVKTKVTIYDGRTWPGSRAKKLWEGNTDVNGGVHFLIPKYLKNKHIHLWVMRDHFEHLSEDVTVSELGLFHTVRLTICVLHTRTEKLAVNPQEAYKSGQVEMQKLYRNAKHKNHVIKFIFVIVTIAAAFIGWFIADIVGLTIGCALAVVSLLLGSYASGHKKGI